MLFISRANNMDLTIGISTMKSKESELISYCEQVHATFPTIKFLIVSQGHSVNYSRNYNWGKIIYCEIKGLSNSRNIVLENAETDWLWFQDDDIHLNFVSIPLLLNELKVSCKDMHFIKVGSLENPLLMYKNYSFHKKCIKLNALKISSIEILLRPKVVKKLGVKFDSKLGLGTEMPSCEENKFIYDLFSKGVTYNFSNLVTCFHTTDEGNRSIDHEARYKAKGYFLKRSIPFCLGFLLALKWIFVSKNKVSLFKRFSSILNGVANARKS